MMLWSNYRLSKNWQFQQVFEKKQRLVNHNFVIYFLSAPTLSNCTYGISVPKNLVKKATFRNRYRRQIRNMLINFLRKNKSCCFDDSHCHQKLLIIMRQKYLAENFETNQKNLYDQLVQTYYLAKQKKNTGRIRRRV